jgi:hypothetical protein
MSKYLDDVFNGGETIRNEAYDIQDLSRAFALTGNEQLSGHLWRIAERLFDADKQIQDAVSTEITQIMHDTQKRTGDVVLAALDHHLIKEGA